MVHSISKQLIFSCYCIRCPKKSESWEPLDRVDNYCCSIYYALLSLIDHLLADYAEALVRVCGEGAEEYHVDEGALSKGITTAKELRDLVFSACHHSSNICEAPPLSDG